MQQGTQEREMSVSEDGPPHPSQGPIFTVSRGPLKGLLEHKTSCKVLTVDKPISQIILNWRDGKSHVQRSCSQKCCF